MDYRNNFEEDKSTIVYGHHMRNKTMFGELANYKDENFFNGNNLINIEYKGKTYTYQVFSTYVADLTEDYLKVYFENDEYYQSYINYITNRSMYKSNLQVSKEDKIIPLGKGINKKNSRTFAAFFQLHDLELFYLSLPPIPNQPIYTYIFNLFYP